MRFDCFGSRCGVWTHTGAADARRQLELWHRQFSRFRADSELSRLNADRRAVVPVSATMARLLVAIREAAQATGGLVDATLVHELEDAGYRDDLGEPVALDVALATAPPRAPARPNPASRTHELEVVRAHPTARIRTNDGRLEAVLPAPFAVMRPAGLAFDSGGLAKGLFADLIAERLQGDFAVDCGGDLRCAGRPRKLEVADPFGGPPLHVFELEEGAAATSGIGARSWIGPDGRPAHHLLDPATGTPAFTGVVQATALAPTALEAEWRAKAAVLSGDGAWLVHGGLLVHDDGHQDVFALTLPQAAERSASAAA